MAESSTLLINKGSDLEHNTCCYVCEENGSRTDAEYFCEQCTKYYCETCNGQHSQTFKMHMTVRSDVRTSWGGKSQSIIKPIFQCMDHFNEKIELFCKDHDQLLCLVCDLNHHRKCRVTRIADKIKDGEVISDCQQMICNIKTHQEQLQKRKEERLKDIQHLRASGEEQHKSIELFRKEINESIDLLEKRAQIELLEQLASLQTEFETDIKQCSSISENLQSLSDIIQNLGESAAESYIAHRKYIELTRKAISLNGRNTRQGSVQFEPHTVINHYVSSMLQLGYVTSEKVTNSNECLKVQWGFTYHEVRLDVEKQSCCMTGICELPSGVFVILDSANKTVKLLDAHYKVVTHLLLSSSPESVCKVDAREVAVSIKTKNVYKLYFLRVDENKLIKTKSFYFNHSCISITYCLASVYVTTGEELYMYALDGRQIKKIYEDTSSRSTSVHAVGSCAASTDGNKIYVFNEVSESLLTLSLNGDILAVLKYETLKLYSQCKSPRVSVALTGHVFICCANQQDIVQVNTDGTLILARLKDYAVESPSCVCYSERASAVLVGTTNAMVVIDKQ
ncbi:probable E3 ubiquitin-protein ligase MID2 [Dreissena polymorpha]|uniref:B box-type domain-containing protein n=1 Tax=Dreissena polymorpha TaxID=45954 RepID=A0A9D4GIV1_DREPO|nr:probable E3 ubiquitin-protein ligase MID2 [Dreissena polymorpha]XP_052286908.1 probable E3 ubiquitin-protein ligase MID2 [Dreissena polymorpha]KAH3818004.1 hypothetical protein DPMN_119589 [Dreissena polymorpha]